MEARDLRSPSPHPSSPRHADCASSDNSCSKTQANSSVSHADSSLTQSCHVSFSQHAHAGSVQHGDEDVSMKKTGVRRRMEDNDAQNPTNAYVLKQGETHDDESDQKSKISRTDNAHTEAQPPTACLRSRTCVILGPEPVLF